MNTPPVLLRVYGTLHLNLRGDVPPITGAYAMGEAPGSCPQWLHHNPQYNIIVSGEAILSAENSGKPLGGRGSAPNPAGSSQRSADPLAGGRGLLSTPKNSITGLCLQPFGLTPMKNPGFALD